MTESSFSEKTAAAKKFFSATAKLAQKQAELATLNNVTLPKLYHSIGKRVVGQDKLPAELEQHRQNIRQLEADIAAAPKEMNSDPTGGFVAKAKEFAQQTAHMAAKATGDAAASVQIHAAYVACGKEAVQRYGLKAVPTDMHAGLSATTDKITDLTKEIADIQACTSQGLVTPRRILLVGGSLLGLLLALFVLRTLGGLVFGRSRPALDYQQLTQDVMNSPEYKQIASDGNKVAADAAAEITRAVDSTKADMERERQSAEHTGRMANLQTSLNNTLSEWEKDAQAVLAPLIRDDSLTSSSQPSDLRALEPLARTLTDALRKDFSEARSRLNKNMQASLSEIEQRSTSNADDAQKCVDNLTTECSLSMSALAHTRQDSLARIKEQLAAHARLLQELPGKLASLVASEVQRWKSESSAMCGSLLNDVKLSQVALQPTPDRFTSREEELRKRLTQMVATRGDRVSQQADRLVGSRPTSLTAADIEDSGQRILNKAKDDISQKVSQSLAEIEDVRTQSIDELVTLTSSLKQMQMQEAQRASVALSPERRVSVTEQLTDSDLAEIVKTAPDITHLDLLRCRNLTDQCFDSLSQLKHLRWLRLPQPNEFTASSFAKMKDLRFDYLDVSGRLLNDPEGIGAFMRMYRNLSEATMHNEFGIPGYFDDSRLKYGDAGLEQFKGLTILGLTLPRVGITDAGLRGLQQIQGLKYLKVYLTGDMTDEGIKSLQGCRSLRKLELVDPAGAKGEAPASLTHEALRGLAGLALDECVIPVWLKTDECLDPYLKALDENAVGRRFVVFDTPRGNGWTLSPVTVKALAGKRGIREIEISGHDRNDLYVDDWLEPLWDAPDLQTVSFKSVRLTGEGLRNATKASKLQSVSLIDCIVLEDVALESLGQCKALERVTVGNAPRITAEGLMSLSGCETLRQVHVDGTKARVADGLKLENASKNCRVSVE